MAVLNICPHCKNIFTPREFKLVSEKDGISVFHAYCEKCGAGLEIIVRSLCGPTISPERLKEISNINR